jgi:condensin complex subunit 3
VRKSALWNIEINDHTLPFILSRARDVDPSVRAKVYLLMMQDHFDFDSLSKEDKNMLLQQGLFDRYIECQ